MSKLKDLTGITFGRLTVIKRAENQGKYVVWECECSCGNTVLVKAASLSSGNTKSCGCLKHEHPYMITHGLSKHRLYSIWIGMKGRCYNPNDSKYKNYGERGIAICDEWKNDFKAFYDWSMNNGYEETLTIERIDVNGNYTPENCTWIPMLEQCRNTTKVRWIEYNGESKLLSDWAKDIGIDPETLSQRIEKWGINKAMTTPLLRRPRLITYNGETHNLPEWSKITGIHKNTLEKRLLSGWSVEDMLTVKPDPNRTPLKRRTNKEEE